MNRIGFTLDHLDTLQAVLSYSAAAGGYRASARKSLGATGLLAALAGTPVAAARVINLWFSRMHQRQALAELDERLLRDIGVTRHDAESEVAKPFWR